MFFGAGKEPRLCLGRITPVVHYFPITGQPVVVHTKTQHLLNVHKSWFLRVQQERADSPVPSCVSMKSDHSMGIPARFKDGNQSIEKRRVQQERADSPVPSCVSMKSDWSMEHPCQFKDGHPSGDER
ncbi:hypothetical protein N1851_003998 [Merluccius polli]|uniref:Uncharacterized protein n=1 Tax=Merluccius polli TaxID=89951 RepID=A0AA47PBZ9_MERPO|nr:hypothetical protein N1851_003998 [Merluccius polli]